MPRMFCPQCGLELDLDSGKVRFCRYCGFALDDTKDALHGYSKQKRVGFSVVTWSYALLLLLTLLLHAKYVPLDTAWGYWLSALLIMASVSFFVSAAVSALKPELLSKSKEWVAGAFDSGRDSPNYLRKAEEDNLPAAGLIDLNEHERSMVNARRSGSVTEDTTRRLDK